MQNSVAKKIFAVGSAAAMALAMFAPFTALAAVHAAGTNVVSSDGTVWMIMPDNTRRAYTSAGAFLSYGFNSWSQVVTASAEDLALAQGSFIPPQDGSIICSDRNDSFAVKGTCYEISGGQKFGVTSAAIFTGLGFSFANASTADVSWMSAGSQLLNSTTAAHLPGTLVNNAGTVQLMGNSGLLGIPDVATFNSWGYSFTKVVPANAADKALTQTGVMATRVAGQLSPTALASNPSVPGVVSGSVSASLASDTPAAQTVAISGTVKTVVTLAKFVFSGTGTVTQLQVKRLGVSADTDLSNVYLFNGDTRLTDAASVGGSSLISFNNPSGLFTVSGNMTVSVVAEIPLSTSAGKTIGIQLTSFAVANGTAVSAAISGNLMTTATATDLAYADFGTVTPGDSASQTRSAGVDTEVFRSSVSINNRDMTLSRFIVRNIGSVQQADLNNFRLRIDGTQVAQTQSMDTNGYITFSFSPVTMKAGARTISILADIISGSSRTFQFQIRNTSDVNFMDTQYGTVTGTNDTYPVGSANTVTIDSGTMTIVKASASPSGNVTDGSSDVILAKYTVTAYGEAQKIETLTVGATSSDASVGSLRNGRVLINGVQYGSTATLPKTTNNAYTTGGVSYTLNYTVQPGTPVTLEVHADMYDNDGTNHLGNSDTVTAVLMAGSNNVQKMVSLGYISVPSAYVLGNSLTDVTGSASLSKNPTYASQTTPLPQTAFKVASFNLVGSTSEDITVSSIDLAVAASSSMGTMNNVTMKVAGNMFGTVKSTVAVPTSGVGATSSFSSNYTLVKNSTVAVEVFADLTAPSVSYGSDTLTPRIAVNGTTVNSSAAIVATAAGQTISVGQASLTVTRDAGSPVAAIVAGSQTRTAAAFKFSSTNDQYTISEIIVSLVDATNVTSIVLKDSAGTIATLPGAASSTFSNLSIVVPANDKKVLTVDLVLSSVPVAATADSTSGVNAKVTLHNYKAAPASTGTIAQTTDQAVSGNALYVYKAIPTVTNLTLPSTVLSAGTNTLAKFSISSAGTDIGWAKLKFTITTSTNVTVTAPQVWVADGSQISGTASTTYTSSGMVVEFWPDAEEQISGAKNYVLKATVGGTLVSGAYVSTNITNPSGFATRVSAVTATATNASLVWSDLAVQSHSLTTADWNNDYLVKNLPTDSQTLTK